MKRTSLIELTNMCRITNDNGEVLVEDRVKQDWPGITFPGGHVESGESLNDSMIREIKEETGLTIYEPKLCGVCNFLRGAERLIVLLYETSKFFGQIKSSNEGKIFWVKEDQLLNQNITQGFSQIYQVFKNPDISELFCLTIDANGTHY
ncbi:8-oxo-dGTP diphosphatase [Xylocopilactobacillus apicola]|uniref:8-oxo-dGTP diphosphatase n=1 Tax=Xylocopilactobacillus apicola TaxID=2932184 RepID=A0AAU9D5Y9_9LACO|nr:NUDIX domain-containing protein [Xylocopilactobacillus apicola]BDR58933.1 7,8-dihydro-8-oxoguanine triphosphatase [Xylocopilactobacillus apicola]